MSHLSLSFVKHGQLGTPKTDVNFDQPNLNTVTQDVGRIECILKTTSTTHKPTPKVSRVFAVIQELNNGKAAN